MTTRRMLINAAQSEEVRVAITEGQKLFDLDIESSHRAQKKANIYKAKISRIEPSLNAVFVDYGAERHGFLPIKEIASEYLAKPIESASDAKGALREGQELIIQIEKEERGAKGAAVTTYITLAGCYLVLMPNSPKAGGISRRISGDERQQLKDSLNTLNKPKNMGVIIRTAGMGRAAEELQWDLDSLLKLWDAVKSEAGKRVAPFLIYQESDVVLRSIRDYLRQNINEIVVDEAQTHKRVVQHVKQLRPEFVDRIKLYEEPIPLFNKYRLEKQIEMAYQREIRLPSGGSIVIDHTEALTSIDINSSKATKGGNIEETAYQTNLEAAAEVAHQLRIRDLGGLVVIDFIDMMDNNNQRSVEEHLYKALQPDRARVQTNRISRFGLLEMSRQRLRPSLGEATSIVCPRCQGHGSIRSVHSIGIPIIRMIKSEAISRDVKQIEVQLPVDVATFLLNEKRHLLDDIEQQFEVRILIIPNSHMQTPDYEFKRSRHQKDNDQSFDRIKKPEADDYQYSAELGAAESPAIKGLDVSKAPVVKKASFWSSVGKLCSSLFGTDKLNEAANSVPARRKHKPVTSPGRRSPQTTSNQRSSQQRPPQKSQSQVQSRRVQQRPQQKRQQPSRSPSKDNIMRETQTAVVKETRPERDTTIVGHAMKQAPELPTVVFETDISMQTFVYEPKHPGQVQSKTQTRGSVPSKLQREVVDKVTRLTKPALKALMEKIAEQHGNAIKVESKAKSKSAEKLVYHEIKVGRYDTRHI